MRMLTVGFAVSLGLIANSAQAQQTINVEGTEFTVPELMENCTNMSSSPTAQIACFNAVSALLKEQSGTATQEVNNTESTTLNALRSVASHQDEDSGLAIVGTDCKIQIIYFGNYFHISRRNVSTIDAFSAEFDASKLQYDKVTQASGEQSLFFNGLMDDGEIATIRGGAELDSSRDNFAAKSARQTLVEYAQEVVKQLPETEDQSFNFALVHPKKQDASEEIMSAFEAFVNECKQ